MQYDHMSKASTSWGPLVFGAFLMKYSLVAFLLLGLVACGGPYVEQSPRKEDAPVKTGVTISGEARVGVKTTF